MTDKQEKLFAEHISLVSKYAFVYRAARTARNKHAAAVYKKRGIEHLQKALALL